MKIFFFQHWVKTKKFKIKKDLLSIGFSLMVDHPHPIIIKTIQALGSKLDDGFYSMTFLNIRWGRK